MFLRKEKLITENALIRIRVSYTGNRVESSTGFMVDLEDWDEITSRVKVGSKNTEGRTAEEINISLDEYENGLNKFFFAYSVRDSISMKEEVKTAFERIRFGKQPKKEIERTI